MWVSDYKNYVNNRQAYLDDVCEGISDSDEEDEGVDQEEGKDGEEDGEKDGEEEKYSE